MKIKKIQALIFRDFLILTRAKWRLVETIYFPVTTIIIWGFFALYSKELAVEAGLIVMIANIFWNFANIAQTTADMQIMEDLWAGSLKQILLSGITEFEYIAARLITATATSLIAMVPILFFSGLFVPEIFANPWNLFLIAIAALIGSLALAVMIAAVIIASGREYGFIAWTAIQLFILLSAPFHPIEIFPKVLQYISYFMPFTYVFEASRTLATYGVVENIQIVKAFFGVFVYFIISWPFYFYFFKKARMSGMLAKA